MFGLIYQNLVRTLLLRQMKAEVTAMSLTLKRKRLTDKQLLYIFNMILVPRIKYKTQVTYLTESQCNSIVTSFRSIFKHKLKFASTAPNVIMDNPHLYKFHNLYDIQVQSKISNFIIQINDRNLLGDFTRIRLLQIQHQEWLRLSPLCDWPYAFLSRFYSSHIRFMLS